ncbi:AAA family ATPase [Bradyrhizobium jicamae]|uniref:AAA family ATPase n=1 Tax=Bradyrhizobium jicamae TaxID=280332 RepID=A0ABS5FKL6_9BRAD|nr:AAA family ATPase [Bradyrhizobium jicamae]MBR0797306.1 AAA family ATPase [Bradyrhizobium jicamae]
MVHERISLEHAEPANPRRAFIMYAEIDDSTSSKSWLVDRILGCGELSAVYGPPGCGKGVLVEDMALHVCAGLEWHGKPVTRGAVVYVALERKALVERRALAFRKKYGLQDLPFAILGGVYDFRDERTAKEIIGICKEVHDLAAEPVVLVIVDTVSRALAGGDENSPRDMGALVTTTARIQERTKAHVLLVHHIPHDSERLRGHGSLLGAVDTTLSVSNSGDVRSAKVVKANDSEEGEAVSFKIEGIEISRDGTTAPVAIPCEARPAEPRKQKLTANQQTMLGILQDAGRDGLSTADWNTKARDLDIGANRRATLHDCQRALKKHGLVREYMGTWHAT